jgi:hypothetical protein
MYIYEKYCELLSKVHRVIKNPVIPEKLSGDSVLHLH